MILDVFKVFAVVVDLTCAVMILQVSIWQTLVLYCGYVAETALQFCLVLLYNPFVLLARWAGKCHLD